MSEPITKTEPKFLLTKEKGKERFMMKIESEEELVKHLQAMLLYTQWHLVSVVRQ
jgi:hypothetical protein